MHFQSTLSDTCNWSFVFKTGKSSCKQLLKCIESVLIQYTPHLHPLCIYLQVVLSSPFPHTTLPTLRRKAQVEGLRHPSWSEGLFVGLTSAYGQSHWSEVEFSTRYGRGSESLSLTVWLSRFLTPCTIRTGCRQKETLASTPLFCSTITAGSQKRHWNSQLCRNEVTQEAGRISPSCSVQSELLQIA